jgi:hypothetical protein
MAGLEKGIVILSAARTPFGKFCGALKDVTATELGVIAGRAAIAYRSKTFQDTRTKPLHQLFPSIHWLKRRARDLK